MTSDITLPDRERPKFPPYYVNARLKEDALLLRGEVVHHVPRIPLRLNFATSLMQTKRLSAA